MKELFVSPIFCTNPESPSYHQCQTLHFLCSSLLEDGFVNLDLWDVESFGNVMEIFTAQGVRTLHDILINSNQFNLLKRFTLSSGEN
jgi:hypothetical protein